MKLLELCVLNQPSPKKIIIGRERMPDYLEYDRCDRGVWNKHPSDLEILRQPGLKYLPEIFIVYSGFA